MKNKLNQHFSDRQVGVGDQAVCQGPTTQPT
jgi:hypothetical protein